MRKLYQIISGFAFGATVQLASAQTVVTSGLQLWLKADAGVTTSSGKVSSWLDQSGQSIVFSQSTSGQRPTFQATGMGTMPGIQFDGVGTVLVSPTINLHNGSTDWTVMVVVKPAASEQ